MQSFKQYINEASLSDVTVILKAVYKVIESPKVDRDDKAGYETMADYLNDSNSKAATNVWNKMDTAARDYLSDMARKDAKLKSAMQKVMKVNFLF